MGAAQAGSSFLAKQIQWPPVEEILKKVLLHVHVPRQKPRMRTKVAVVKPAPLRALLMRTMQLPQKPNVRRRKKSEQRRLQRRRLKRRKQRRRRRRKPRQPPRLKNRLSHSG